MSERKKKYYETTKEPVKATITRYSARPGRSEKYESVACPFCGNIDLTLLGASDDHFIHCDPKRGGCDAEGPWKGTSDDAIDAWNQRVET